MADYLPLTGQLLVANQNGSVSSAAGIKMDWTGLEPRVGGTWKVLGSDKTVLRAGYAIFHDSAWSQGAQGLWQNPPFLGESDGFGAQGCAFATSYCATTLGQTPSALSLSNGFPGHSHAAQRHELYGNASFTCPPNINTAWCSNINVNVERQLPGNVVLTAGYAGSHGHTSW